MNFTARAVGEEKMKRIFVQWGQIVSESIVFQLKSKDLRELENAKQLEVAEALAQEAKEKPQREIADNAKVRIFSFLTAGCT